MRSNLVVVLVLATAGGIACSPRDNTSMGAIDFFATPPVAERAFLSAYESQTLNGQFGIRIETGPLSFVEPQFERELEPEIRLSYLSLPSVDPEKLENTRFSPDSSYEGSFYFLAEHNWVDLTEIRFLNATANSILAEYDLVIHLPTIPPNEYPVTLRVQTEIKTADPQLESPRSLADLGTLVQTKENSWTGTAYYNGRDVEIELAADTQSFQEIAAYARSVITEETLPRSKIEEEITEWLPILADNFKRSNVSSDFHAKDFIPRRFYFYKRRHHDSPEVIIGLDHPADVGHWSLEFSRIDEGGLLHWTPKS